MSLKESIKEFRKRLTTVARKLGGVYPRDFLIFRLIRGLLGDARDIDRLEPPK